MTTNGTNFPLTDGIHHIFSDARNSVVFFSISSLTATLGNFVLHILRKFVSENQYSSLNDWMESLFFLISMVANIHVLAMGMIYQLSYPHTSHFTCASLTIFLRLLYVMGVIISLQSTIIRLLYLTKWKNVGAINDEFFMRFLSITMTVLSILYMINLSFFGGYEAYPNYIICSGVSKSYSMETDFMQYVTGLTFLAVSITVYVLARERKTLQKCHTETRLPSGLPRLGDTHQAVFEYKTYILGYFMTVVFVVLSQFQFRYTIVGRISVFPYSLSYIFCLSFPGFSISFFYAPLKIWNNKKLQHYFKRHLYNCLQIY